MATVMTRYWVWTVDGEYGYLFADKKPLPFDWAWVFITPAGSVRPVKTWAKISLVENYN